MMLTDRTLASVFSRTEREFKLNSAALHPHRWQGVEVSKKPEMQMYEIVNHYISLLLTSENLDFYRDEVKPNLPWADDHFVERVCGEPINPGVEWANWPWGDSARKFIEDGGQFNHNYMERYWPKYAGKGKFNGPIEGIRNKYGDLDDVVALLLKEPDTRQAYLPIFFPEDTGIGDGGRKPCTLGYHFMRRDDRLSIFYPMRSCDYVRHFRDDIYLTIRLLLWVMERLREKDPVNWSSVRPGYYSMFISSLHMFKNDWPLIFGEHRG